MKKILIALLGVVVLLVLAAALMPKDFKIEREIVINKSQVEVFDYLKMMKNEHEWSPWAKKDPNMKQEIKGRDGTVGGIHAWSGNKEVGVGEAEIMALTPNTRIDLELRFSEPMKATHKAYYLTEEVTLNETKVVWGMTGRTAFPFNLVCFFMQKKVAHEFEEGLKNLKVVLEEKK